METPVVLFIFNRPDTTKEVAQAISQAKPKKLFVIADGPRLARDEEKEKCITTRAIIDSIDWNCEVIKNYSQYNLGCSSRVSSGINWVFEQVDEAIILEDDCLPHPTFFNFCEELLEKYRQEPRIMSICGSNLQFGRRRTQYSYYFSRYGVVWGWATWRRAWKYYSYDMENWSRLRETDWLSKFHNSRKIGRFWKELFDEVSARKHTWDYQWFLSCWLQNGFSVIPNENLISNIGFDMRATHTTHQESIFSGIPTQAINFPLNIPPNIIWNEPADKFIFNHYWNVSLLLRLQRKLKNLLVP